MGSPYRPYKNVYTQEEVIGFCKNANFDEVFHKSWLISHYRPAFTDYFAGRSIDFHFDTGDTFYCRFKDAHTILWGEKEDDLHEEYYEALPSTVSGVYLIHFLSRQVLPYPGYTIVVDTDTELVTCVVHTIGTWDCNANVANHFMFGYYGKEKKERHGYTCDMCGVILDWKYSDDFIIRHEYVTPYSALSPGEPTDNEEAYLFRKTLPATYSKVRDNLCIMSFIEDGGSDICLLIDLRKEKCHDVGAFYGIGDGKLTCVTIGAVAGRGKFGFDGKYSIEYGPEPEEDS